MLQRADARLNGPAARPNGTVSCPGVDRVLWLRVRLRDGQPSDGVVHGVRHRRPVEVPVGADVVRRLRRAGVPTVEASA